MMLLQKRKTYLEPHLLHVALLKFCIIAEKQVDDINMSTEQSYNIWPEIKYIYHCKEFIERSNFVSIILNLTRQFEKYNELTSLLQQPWIFPEVEHPWWPLLAWSNSICRCLAEPHSYTFLGHLSRNNNIKLQLTLNRVVHFMTLTQIHGYKLSKIKYY